ncbi:MAG TPA: PAS domain S-box protein [Paludibacteraceae bacterium]|nr:PAS domain S-box protein [Paludibacteraceae bacterium]
MRKLKIKGLYQLFVILLMITLFLTVTSIVIIYKIVYQEKRVYLRELCESRKEFIESIYQQTNNPAFVLEVLYKQQRANDGLGISGEFIIGIERNDSIQFLYKSKQKVEANYTVIPKTSDKGIPLQYALSKKTGFIQGIDYQGVLVLSYCTYIPELKWGVVTKMALSEVRLPFYRAGFIAIIASFILFLIATIFFRKISFSIKRKIDDSEEKLTAILNASQESIFMFDQKGTIIIANDIASQRLKKTLPEIIGKHFSVFIPEEIVHERWAYLTKVFDSGKPYQFEAYRDDAIFEHNLYPVFENKKVAYVVSFSQDITERKGMVEQKEFHSKVMETMHDAVIATDTSFIITVWNNAAEKLYGWSRKEVLNKNSRDILKSTISDDDLKKMLSELKTDNNAHYETIQHRKDGTPITIEARLSVIRDEKGEIVSYIAANRDISERKAAEAALQKSEASLKRSQEMAHLGSWDLDIKTNIVIWSDEVYRIFGMKPQESDITYEIFLSRIHPDDRDSVVKAYSGSISEARDTYEVDHRIIKKNSGEIRFVHEKCSHIRDDSGFIIRSVGMVHDITERVMYEEALKQSEESVRLKLQSIMSPEGNIEKLELEDIIDTQAIQSLMNNLHVLVNIPVAIIDLKGKVLVGVGWQEICTKFHRVHPETCKNCIESDVQLTRGTPEGEYKLYKCKNNMWDIATPIIIGGEQKGNLFMGQFFFDDEQVDHAYFVAKAKKFGFDEKEYISALEKVPRLSRQKLEYAKSFFREFAHSLSQLSYSNIKLARSISEQDKIAKKLNDTNNYLEALINYANVPIIVWNPQFEIQVFNKSFEHLSGFLSEEVIGTKLDFLFPPESLTDSMEKIISASFEKLESVEILIQCKDKEAKTVLWNSANIYDTDNKTLISIIAQGVDVTERKRIETALKESEENYHRLFEFSAIPIWKEDYSEIKKHFEALKISGVTDFRKYFETHMDEVIHLASLIKVVEINHKSLEFYGAESKEDVIKNMLFYFNEESLNVFREELIALASGEKKFECEMPMRTLSGNVMILDLHLSVVKGFEDTLSNILVSFIDITERKRFENELQEKNEELKETNATKDKFFNIIAHDMKNPYISLLGASELLYENAKKYDRDKIITLAKILNDSAKSGYDMLLNMLEWARSQAGSMIFQPEKINLKALIDKGLSNLIEYAGSKKVNLKFDIPDSFQVYADKNMLTSILRNLITNALKFTPEGGDVIVWTKEENRSIIVFIKDTGVGIEKADLSKLFRSDIKYSHPGTNHEGGTGLGLLLCKEFVEKHGGKIWVESQVRKGSVFYFSIPEKIV